MPRTISATISHKFEVSEVEKAGVDEAMHSPEVDVVHNNVTLKFYLRLSPKDSAEDDDHIGIYVSYKDGPQAKIQMEYKLFVINGRKKHISLFEDADDQEFNIHGDGYSTWGCPNALPRSVKALKDGGYLSSYGKILHIGVELSIPETAFVRPLQIFASLSHKFDVQEFINGDRQKSIDGSVVSVVHNNVKLGFELFAHLNIIGQNYHDNNCIGLYVRYIKGPQNEIEMDMEIIVVKGRKRHSLAKKRFGMFAKGAEGLGCAKLPRTIEALRAGGYLSWDNKLHVIAELSIPKCAFAIPEHKPSFIQVDSLGFDRHQELDSPADTTSPASNRVQLVSKDGSYLWGHKDVLSSASEVFMDLFDPNRPEETKLDCFKKGVLTFDDLSGEALKQMLHFVYLRQTGKEFENFALEIVPVADQFLIKGLKEACERSLIEGMDLLSMDALCDCLAASYTFNLSALTLASTETLPMFIQHNDDIDQKHLEKLIDLSQQHSLGPLKSACEAKLAHIMRNSHDRALFLSLLSLARKNQLEMLATHCVRWFKNKFDVLKADGFVRALFDDTSENGRDVHEFLFESMATLPMP